MTDRRHYRGDRVWNDHELEDGIWVSFATRDDRGVIVEVGPRVYTRMNLNTGVFEEVRIKAKIGSKIEYYAVSPTQLGPVAEYLRNGHEVADHAQYDTTLRWRPNRLTRSR